jgi:predicted N-acyltransferase
MGFASFIPFLRSINRRKRPNMRLEFDYESRKGIQKIERKNVRQLSAREIAQIRFMLSQDKKVKRKRQLLILAISIIALITLVWLFLFLFNWFAAQPADIYNPNVR